jgi:tRNA (guanine-N7-)-methyltransferase
MTAETRSHRPIRSFVRRESRITPSQRRALHELWPRFGVTPTAAASIDLDALFRRAAPRVLEIGFGNGDALIAMAASNPGNDYLGIEVHRPGVGQALRELAARELNNVRVCCADVNDVLTDVPDGALTAVYVFFPDPWPKKRHHKRRLVQAQFVQQVRRTLIHGGLLCLATDWEDYAVQMMTVLSEAAGFENTVKDGGYAPRPAERPLTKFERRGQRLGHSVYDLVFRRVG